MLIRLLGAYCPNTVAGTIVGNPIAAAAPNPVFKKFRRETPAFRLLLMSVSNNNRRTIAISWRQSFVRV
jgi:hypothetical protein